MFWSSLLEGWPIFAAMAFVVVLTYGAVRPYLKKDKAREKLRKETEK